MQRICLPAKTMLTRGVAQSAKLWDNGSTITIAFLTGDDFQIEMVKRFSVEWTKHANLHFQFVSGRRAQVKVGFLPGGSWSEVGTDCLDNHGQTVNFGWITRETPIEEIRQVILHEFGHVIGLEHEHQSPEAAIPWDMEAVYRSMMGPPNYWDMHTIDINIFDKIAAERATATAFDPQSIMLYAVPPEFTGGKMSVAWSKELSAGDIKFVSGLYPKEQ